MTSCSKRAVYEKAALLLCMGLAGLMSFLVGIPVLRLLLKLLGIWLAAYIQTHVGPFTF